PGATANCSRATGAAPRQTAPERLPTNRAGATPPATARALDGRGSDADHSPERILRLVRQLAGKPRRIEIGRQAAGHHRARSRRTTGGRPAAWLRARLTEEEKPLDTGEPHTSLPRRRPGAPARVRPGDRPAIPWQRRPDTLGNADHGRSCKKCAGARSPRSVGHGRPTPPFGSARSPT